MQRRILQNLSSSAARKLSSHRCCRVQRHLRHNRLNSSKAVLQPKDKILLEESADDLIVLFDVDSKKGKEIAGLISQSARKELSQIRRKLNLDPARAPKFTGIEGGDFSEPSKRDLRMHALTQGIPFIGFGIMDNAILIYAGDMIDTHLGVMFGISTLCAAAIGNIISDLAGVGFGAYIEDFCARRLQLPKINLSNAQRQMRSVRMAGQMGNCIGLTIGCIIGMFPLLLIDTEHKVEKEKNDTPKM